MAVAAVGELSIVASFRLSWPSRGPTGRFPTCACLDEADEFALAGDADVEVAVGPRITRLTPSFAKCLAPCHTRARCLRRRRWSLRRPVVERTRMSVFGPRRGRQHQPARRRSHDGHAVARRERVHQHPWPLHESGRRPGGDIDPDASTRNTRFRGGERLSSSSPCLQADPYELVPCFHGPGPTSVVTPRGAPPAGSP